MISTAQAAGARRLVRAGVALLVAVATLVDLGEPAVASISYERFTRQFQSQPLRTRGYYPVSSCVAYDVACYSVSSRYRAEPTAQAKVIQELSRVRYSPTSAADVTISPKVQWEVAPKPDTDYAPSAASPEPPDPDDDDKPALPPNLRWRLDVVVDDTPDPTVPGATPRPSMIEVKRWAGEPTPGVVHAQLAGYVDKTRSAGLDFVRNTELKRRVWSRAYTGDFRNGELDMWCVWADITPNLPTLITDGNVYFAPKADMCA